MNKYPDAEQIESICFTLILSTALITTVMQEGFEIRYMLEDGTICRSQILIQTQDGKIIYVRDQQAFNLLKQSLNQESQKFIKFENDIQALINSLEAPQIIMERSRSQYLFNLQRDKWFGNQTFKRGSHAVNARINKISKMLKSNNGIDVQDKIKTMIELTIKIDDNLGIQQELLGTWETVLYRALDQANYVQSQNPKATYLHWLYTLCQRIITTFNFGQNTYKRIVAAFYDLYVTSKGQNPFAWVLSSSFLQFGRLKEASQQMEFPKIAMQYFQSLLKSLEIIQIQQAKSSTLNSGSNQRQNDDDNVNSIQLNSAIINSGTFEQQKQLGKRNGFRQLNNSIRKSFHNRQSFFLKSQAQKSQRLSTGNQEELQSSRPSSRLLSRMKKQFSRDQGIQMATQNSNKLATDSFGIQGLNQQIYSNKNRSSTQTPESQFPPQRQTQKDRKSMQSQKVTINVAFDNIEQQKQEQQKSPIDQENQSNIGNEQKQGSLSKLSEPRNSDSKRIIIPHLSDDTLNNPNALSQSFFIAQNRSSSKLSGTKMANLLGRSLLMTDLQWIIQQRNPVKQSTINLSETIGDTGKTMDTQQLSNSHQTQNNSLKHTQQHKQGPNQNENVVSKIEEDILNGQYVYGSHIQRIVFSILTILPMISKFAQDILHKKQYDQFSQYFEALFIVMEIVNNLDNFAIEQIKRYTQVSLKEIILQQLWDLLAFQLVEEDFTPISQDRINGKEEQESRISNQDRIMQAIKVKKPVNQFIKQGIDIYVEKVMYNTSSLQDQYMQDFREYEDESILQTSYKTISRDVVKLTKNMTLIYDALVKIKDPSVWNIHVVSVCQLILLSQKLLVTSIAKQSLKHQRSATSRSFFTRREAMGSGSDIFPNPSQAQTQPQQNVNILFQQNIEYVWADAPECIRLLDVLVCVLNALMDHQCYDSLTAETILSLIFAYQEFFKLFQSFFFIVILCHQCNYQFQTQKGDSSNKFSIAGLQVSPSNEAFQKLQSTFSRQFWDDLCVHLCKFFKKAIGNLQSHQIQNLQSWMEEGFVQQLDQQATHDSFIMGTQELKALIIPQSSASKGFSPLNQFSVVDKVFVQLHFLFDPSLGLVAGYFKNLPKIDSFKDNEGNVKKGRGSSLEQDLRKGIKNGENNEILDNDNQVQNRQGSLKVYESILELINQVFEVKEITQNMQADYIEFYTQRCWLAFIYLYLKNQPLAMQEQVEKEFRIARLHLNVLLHLSTSQHPTFVKIQQELGIWNVLVKEISGEYKATHGAYGAQKVQEYNYLDTLKLRFFGGQQKVGGISNYGDGRIGEPQLDGPNAVQLFRKQKVEQGRRSLSLNLDQQPGLNLNNQYKPSLTSKGRSKDSRVPDLRILMPMAPNSDQLSSSQPKISSRSTLLSNQSSPEKRSNKHLTQQSSLQQTNKSIKSQNLNQAQDLGLDQGQNLVKQESQSSQPTIGGSTIENQSFQSFYNHQNNLLKSLIPPNNNVSNGNVKAGQKFQGHLPEDRLQSNATNLNLQSISRDGKTSINSPKLYSGTMSINSSKASKKPPIPALQFKGSLGIQNNAVVSQNKSQIQGTLLPQTTSDSSTFVSTRSISPNTKKGGSKEQSYQQPENNSIVQQKLQPANTLINQLPLKSDNVKLQDVKQSYNNQQKQNNRQEQNIRLEYTYEQDEKLEQQQGKEDRQKLESDQDLDQQENSNYRSEQRTITGEQSKSKTYTEKLRETLLQVATFTGDADEDVDILCELDMLGFEDVHISKAARLQQMLLTNSYLMENFRNLDTLACQILLHWNDDSNAYWIEPYTETVQNPESLKQNSQSNSLQNTLTLLQADEISRQLNGDTFKAYNNPINENESDQYSNNSNKILDRQFQHYKQIADQEQLVGQQQQLGINPNDERSISLNIKGLSQQQEQKQHQEQSYNSNKTQEQEENSNQDQGSDQGLFQGQGKVEFADKLRTALMEVNEFCGDADEDVDILLDLEDMGFDNMHSGKLSIMQQMLKADYQKQNTELEVFIYTNWHNNDPYFWQSPIEINNNSAENSKEEIENNTGSSNVNQLQMDLQKEFNTDSSKNDTQQKEFLKQHSNSNRQFQPDSQFEDIQQTTQSSVLKKVYDDRNAQQFINTMQSSQLEGLSNRAYPSPYVRVPSRNIPKLKIESIQRNPQPAQPNIEQENMQGDDDDTVRIHSSNSELESPRVDYSNAQNVDLSNLKVAKKLDFSGKDISNQVHEKDRQAQNIVSLNIHSLEGPIAMVDSPNTLPKLTEQNLKSRDNNIQPYSGEWDRESLRRLGEKLGQVQGDQKVQDYEKIQAYVDNTQNMYRSNSFSSIQTRSSSQRGWGAGKLQVSKGYDKSRSLEADKRRQTQQIKGQNLKGNLHNFKSNSDCRQENEGNNQSNQDDNQVLKRLKIENQLLAKSAIQQGMQNKSKPQQGVGLNDSKDNTNIFNPFVKRGSSAQGQQGNQASGRDYSLGGNKNKPFTFSADKLRSVPVITQSPLHSLSRSNTDKEKLDQVKDMKQYTLSNSLHGNNQIPVKGKQFPLPFLRNLFSSNDVTPYKQGNLPARNPGQEQRQSYPITNKAKYKSLRVNNSYHGVHDNHVTLYSSSSHSESSTNDSITNSTPFSKQHNHQIQQIMEYMDHQVSQSQRDKGQERNNTQADDKFINSFNVSTQKSCESTQVQKVVVANNRLSLDNQVHLNLLLMLLQVNLCQDNKPDKESAFSELNWQYLLQCHLNDESNSQLLPQLILKAQEYGESTVILIRLLVKSLFDESLYTQLQVLGKGQYGMVYECKSPYIEHLASGNAAQKEVVAVKVIDTPANYFSSPVLNEVYKEIKIMLKVKGNLNFIQIYDFGLGREGYFIVMHRYKCSLRQWRENINSQFQISDFSSQIVWLFMLIFQKAISILIDLQRLNIVHFDIKGDNFFLEPYDDVTDNEFWRVDNVIEYTLQQGRLPFRIVLGDFGCAELFTNQEAAHVMEQRGTECVRAPETLMLDVIKVSDERFDRRRHKGPGFPSDIWSLGCLLYELFVGEHLFNEQQAAKMWGRITGKAKILGTSQEKNLKDAKEIREIIQFILIQDPNRRPELMHIQSKVQQILTTVSPQPPKARTRLSNSYTSRHSLMQNSKVILDQATENDRVILDNVKSTNRSFSNLQGYGSLHQVVSQIYISPQSTLTENDIQYGDINSIIIFKQSNNRSFTGQRDIPNKQIDFIAQNISKDELCNQQDLSRICKQFGVQQVQVSLNFIKLTSFGNSIDENLCNEISETLEILVKFLKKSLGPLHNIQTGLIANIFGSNLTLLQSKQKLQLSQHYRDIKFGKVAILAENNVPKGLCLLLPLIFFLSEINFCCSLYELLQLMFQTQDLFKQMPSFQISQDLGLRRVLQFWLKKRQKFCQTVEDLSCGKCACGRLRIYIEEQEIESNEINLQDSLHLTGFQQRAPASRQSQQNSPYTSPKSNPQKNYMSPGKGTRNIRKCSCHGHLWLQCPLSCQAQIESLNNKYNQNLANLQWYQTQFKNIIIDPTSPIGFYSQNKNQYSQKKYLQPGWKGVLCQCCYTLALVIQSKNDDINLTNGDSQVQVLFNFASLKE